MSLWVLDTDMLTLWLRGRETVAARAAAARAATTPHRMGKCSAKRHESLLRNFPTNS